MRDGDAALHRRLRPEGHDPDVPDPAEPHAVQRRPVRRRPVSGRPRPVALCSRKAGYIFVYQDVRGRWMSEGEFVNMRPHIPSQERAEGHRREHRHLRHDRLAGEERARTTTARSACGASRTPASTPSAGMIDAHPALKAASPQAPDHRLVHRRRLPPQRRVVPAARFNFIANFGKPRPEPTTKPAATRFEHGTPDGYEFFLDMGPLANAEREATSRARSPFWNEVMKHGTYDEFWQARNLRPHLKDIKPAVHDRRRLVRRRGPVRRARDLQDDREDTAPATYNTWSWARGVHGGWSRSDGDQLGDVQFDAKTGDFYREQIEFPFFEHHLKGKAGSKTAEGVGVRDRHERVAEARRLAAEETSQPTIAVLPRRRQARASTRRRPSRRRRRSTSTSATRQAGAVHRQDRRSA